MDLKWILFCPQLPATPSSPRVMIWRRMKSAGAVGLDNGLWLLPHNEASLQTVQEMKDYIVSQNGSSKVFLCNGLDEDTNQNIEERFKQDRTEEYSELKEQCADFLKEIQKETERSNFSFAEYEENEQDLNKLEVWFRKIQQRDMLGSDGQQEAFAWLEKCRAALQEFADEVFRHEDQDHDHKMKYDPGKP